MKIFKNKFFYEFLTCLFYFLFFAFISLTGNLKIFVKNFYFPFVIIGISILFSLLVIEIRKIKKFKEIDISNVFSFVIFLFPLILVLLVRPTSLPIYAALKRGIQTEFSSEDVMRIMQEQIESEGKYKKLTIKQLLVFSKSKPEQINEKDVSVEGMVYKSNEKEKFTLIRFLITCCAADATPLGVEVEYREEEKRLKKGLMLQDGTVISLESPEEKNVEFKNEEWVKVKGKVKIEEGKVKIYAEKIEKINPPLNPYLY